MPRPSWLLSMLGHCRALASRLPPHPTSHRFSEDPLIPIGCALLVGVLARGLGALYRGDSKTSYRMMRYRILFQGGVIAALMYSMYFRTQGKDSDAVKRAFAVDPDWWVKHAREYRLDEAGNVIGTPAAEAAGSAPDFSAERA